MYIVAVTVYVKPECIPQFEELILDNASNSRKEKGNLRFDVSQAEDDPAKFLLYEVYQSKEDFNLHQQTPHYLRWKEGITALASQPRVGVRHTPIFYGDARV